MPFLSPNQQRQSTKGYLRNKQYNNAVIRQGKKWLKSHDKFVHRIKYRTIIISCGPLGALCFRVVCLSLRVCVCVVIAQLDALPTSMLVNDMLCLLLNWKSLISRWAQVCKWWTRRCFTKLCNFQHSVTCATCLFMPSVIWRCWLGGSKGIRPVKSWAVGCWHGYLSGARCRLAYGLADATATHCLLLQ